jgi:RpiB/LacA/LacB family sugar-phosphate isomerase
MMKIAIGADSAGKPLLDVIEAHLATKPALKSVDLSQAGFYADMSKPRSAETIVNGRTTAAILICGTGIGVRSPPTRCRAFAPPLTHDTYSAERAAKSNNAQIITMGARVIGPELAKSIVDKWLESEFDPNGSSAGNVEAIDRLDAGK